MGRIRIPMILEKICGIEEVTAERGIHSGSVIAGNIGSDRMLQYGTGGCSQYRC